MSQQKEIRLLIVDGRIEYFQAISEWADVCAYQYPITCKYASCGLDAPKAIADFSPSVVLVDAHLEDTNSFDLVERFRTAPFHIIVMADNHSHEIEESARFKGASGYLTKSDDPDEIEKLLCEISQASQDVENTH